MTPSSNPPEAKAHTDSIRAIQKVVNSQRFKPIIASFIGLLLTGIGGIGGWIIKMLTDRSVQTQMAADIVVIKANIESIKADNSLRNELLRDSFRNPGKVIQLERDQEVVWRELTKLYAAIYATEVERTRKVKRSASLEFKDSYDQRVKEKGYTPIAAYTEVTRTVSVR